METLLMLLCLLMLAAIVAWKVFKFLAPIVLVVAITTFVFVVAASIPGGIFLLFLAILAWSVWDKRRHGQRAL